MAESLKDALAVWPLLDPARLDATFPHYARAMTAVLDKRRAHSTAIASAYLRAFREAEGAKGAFDVALAQDVARSQAMTSLLVTGPVAVKVGVRAGKTTDAATKSALVQTLGTVARHVQNGGRETIYRSVQRDRSALGVARVTDGSPCAFCAMLASRGAVYKDEMSADFEAHDRCGCGAEPVYHPDSAMPGRAQEYRDLWDSSTKGLHGDEAVAAFRKAYAGG